MNAILLSDTPDTEQTLRMCSDRGFGIELQQFPWRDLEENQAQIEHSKTLIENVLVRSIHGPFADLCPGSSDPMVQAVARHRFAQAFHVADAVGANHIVLHHGYAPGTSWRDGWIRRSGAFWRDLLESKPLQTHIHLENLLEWEPTLLADVIEAVALPNIDVALDVGHVHCNSRATELEWIETLGPRIGYTHLHDNNGESDEHLALGDGNIRLEEVLSALNTLSPDALWVLETDAGDATDRSISWLESHGFL